MNCFSTDQTLASSSPPHPVLMLKGCEHHHLTGASKQGPGSPPDTALGGHRYRRSGPEVVTYWSNVLYSTWLLWKKQVEWLVVCAALAWAGHPEFSLIVKMVQNRMLNFVLDFHQLIVVLQGCSLFKHQPQSSITCCYPLLAGRWSYARKVSFGSYWYWLILKFCSYSFA